MTINPHTDLDRAMQICRARFWFAGGSHCYPNLVGSMAMTMICPSINLPPDWELPACAEIERRWKESGGEARIAEAAKAQDEADRALIERMAKSP